jgi:hypothetical protein|tara:strand:- start:431 stop:622 length:192 start_codon:yes stop_codon:yes gene_type:complete
MAMDTWFIVQKFNRKTWEWEERDDDGSSWNSTLSNAKYFCDRHIADGEECRVVKEEVVYAPDA